MTAAPSPSDAQLVSAILAGETERFAVLVGRHQSSLFRHALTLGLDPDTAADMVQDSLIRAWEQLTDCRDPGRFGIWVSRILRNRCLDHLKQASTRRTTRLHLVMDEDGTGPRGADVLVAPKGSDPEALLDGRALSEAVAEALSSLPSDQAEAFSLKYVEGWDYTEMAQVTGASVSALKMRVHRAREAIRGHLETQGLQIM